jgi:tRNA (cmo5U34)-methyltransferase
MNSKLNQYDKIAVVYDRLTTIVFGKSMAEAQKFFLPEIKPGSKILIIGGGTGKILEQIDTLKIGVSIWYIDASQRMIELAKKRVLRNDNVVFIHGTEESIPDEIHFDFIITNFYLDLFPTAEVQNLTIKFRRCLTSEGKWIVTDFIEDERMFTRGLLALMYAFFWLINAISVSSLPSWIECIRGNGFYCVAEKRFYKGFIKTVLYSKGSGTVPANCS